MENVKKAAQYAPLVLAYIGDSLYDVYARTRFLSEHPNMPANKLHMNVSKIVKAHAQSESVTKMMDMLTEDEEAEFRRGRNSKPHNIAKNASLMDYKRATGFEALLGYVYISGDKERLEFLMKTAYDFAVEEV